MSAAATLKTIIAMPAPATPKPGTMPQPKMSKGDSPSVPGTPVLAPTQAYSTFHPLETASTSWTPVAGAATYVWETSQGDPNCGWNNVFRQVAT